jgi:SAM-dependent methyltransferase
MNKCPICNGNSYNWDDIPNGDNLLHLLKCKDCGHGFFFPGVESKEKLLEIYDEDYADVYLPEKNSKEFELRKIQYLADVELLKKHIQNEVNVLDIGCSTGEFLVRMPNSWDKSGFEVNPFELDYLKKNKPEIKLYDELNKIPENQFDIITLRGVIEHFFDFDELFDTIKKCLKKTGQVYICATPDFSSPCATLYKKNWNQIAGLKHYHHFTQSSIAFLFAKHGFGLKMLIHPYESTPYADFNNDANKFINNVQGSVIDTKHAYPGTMMSLLFDRRESI